MKKTSSLAVRLMVLPLLLALVACGSLFPDDQEMVQRAKDYLDKHRVNAAAIELRNALQKNSGNAEARYLLGTIMLSYGDFDTAAKEFRRADIAGWDQGQAATGLAQAMLGMGNYRGVVDEILISDSYRPVTQANLLALRALAEAGLGNAGQAGKSLDAATGLDAGSIQVLMATIQIRLSEGNRPAAETALARALELYPDNKELQLIRAGILSVNGDTAAARKLYQGVIAADLPGFITIQGRQARLGMVRLQLLADELEAAEATIKPLYQRYPRDPETNYLGGVLAFEQGDYDLAEKRAFKVLERAPEHSPTHLLFGTVNFAQQDFEQAAYYLSKYLVSNPDNMVARKLLARTYLLLGQHDDARRILGQAQGEQAVDAELLALAALSELRSGDISAGILGLENAIEANPENTILRSELARARLARDPNATDMMLKWLETAREQAPGDIQSRIILADYYLRLQRGGKAGQLIDEAVKIAPRKPEVLVLQGRLMIQEENFDAALEYSKRALQADPESFAAYELAGNASLGKQDNAAAGKAYAQAWERRQSSRLALRLSSALAVAGNYAEAAGYLEEWLGQHDGDVRAREFLGTMYQHQGKDSKAVAAYEMVLRHESGNPVALNNLAWMYVTDNNPRALELARRAYQADPVNAGIKDTYGWVLVQSGQAEPGLELLAEAMDALPDVPDVRYHYAVALLQSGQQAEGRQRLRELVDGGLPFEGRAAAERLMDEK